MSNQQLKYIITIDRKQSGQYAQYGSMLRRI